MEDKDWNEIYDHLIKKLRALGINDALMEIENLAAVRVDNVKLPKNPANNVTMRSVSPEERFNLATMALKSRLVEIPLIVKKLCKYLERSPKNIKWYPDIEPNKLFVEPRIFACSIFDTTEKEDEEIRNEFQALEDIISEIAE